MRPDNNQSTNTNKSIKNDATQKILRKSEKQLKTLKKPKKYLKSTAGEINERISFVQIGITPVLQLSYSPSRQKVKGYFMFKMSMDPFFTEKKGSS